MADRLTTDELLSAASDAFRGDRTSARSILNGVKERAGARAREALDQRLGDAISGRRPGASSIASKPLPVLRTTTASERALLDELAHQRKAAQRLERENAALSARVEKIEKRTDQALMGVVEGLGQFKKQFGTVGVSEVAALAQAAQLQQLSGVIASVQSAAYGERGAVLSRNNLLLAGNQLAWMFAGPALQRLGVTSGATAQMISTLAPLGTLITGGLTLGRTQHVRFVSGVTTFRSTQLVAVEFLRSRIAEADWEEFSQRTDIPVTVTTITGGAQFAGTAVVQNGLLVITLPDPPGNLLFFRDATSGSVAWMVDTGADGG